MTETKIPTAERFGVIETVAVGETIYAVTDRQYGKVYRTFRTHTEAENVAKNLAPIEELATGTKVYVLGRIGRVGAPEILYGDGEDPDGYVFKWHDGHQWDYVMGGTLFQKSSWQPPEIATKKLHKLSVAYSAL